MRGLFLVRFAERERHDDDARRRAISAATTYIKRVRRFGGALIACTSGRGRRG